MEGGFSRDFLCGIGKGDDAPPPEQTPGHLRQQEMEEEVDLSLGLSLGGLYGIARKQEGKLPARSSSEAAVMTTPVEVPAPPALSWASGSPSSASSQGDGQGLQGTGTLMRTSSLPCVIEAAANEDCKKRKEAQSLKRLEIEKRIERRNSLTCNTSKQEAVANNENHSSGKHLARGRPPKYKATITSQDSLSAVGKKPISPFNGKTVTVEHGSSSSVPSSGAAARPPLPSSLAPRTAATLGSMEDQSILGGAAVLQGRTEWGDVERRMLQEMPGVFTKGLANDNRVEGFLYKYKK